MSQLSARHAAQLVVERLPVSWLLVLRSAYFDEGRSRPRRRWRRALLQLVRLRGIPQDGPFPVPGRPGMQMVPADSYIADHLFWLGIDGYEAGEPAWWASLVASHRSVLELGANIGLYTLVGAAAAPRVPYRAVEANPVSCDVLRRNVALNDLGNVCVVEAAVVGERCTETVTLRFPDRDRYRASAGAFVEGAPDLTIAATRSISVATTAMHDLIDGVDLLKLDIEGLEVEVLEAVRSWLVTVEPTLVVEVLDNAVQLQQFIAGLLDDSRYRCVVIRNGRPSIIQPTPIIEGRLEQTCQTRDVTLVVPERARALGVDGAGA